MVDDHAGDVRRVASMRTHSDRSGVVATRTVDQENVDRFLIASGVLDSQPFVKAEIDIPFGKTVVIRRNRPHQAQNVGATRTLEAAPVGIVAVLEEHLTLNYDLRASRGNLGRDRRAWGNGVDTPHRLAVGIDGDRIGFRRAVGKLQGDVHAGRCIGRINVRDDEVFLELPTGIPLGEKPVAGKCSAPPQHRPRRRRCLHCRH